MDSEYLREIARRCDAISRDCFDLRPAEKMRLLAEELRRKAGQPRMIMAPSIVQGDPEAERDSQYGRPYSSAAAGGSAASPRRSGAPMKRPRD
jgi:hypothetical protein